MILDRLDRLNPGIARTTLASLAVKGAQIALQMAVVALLARLLAPEAYGRYAFLVALALAIAAPAGAACATVATRYTVVYAMHDAWQSTRGLWRALSLWSVLYGTLTAGVFALWSIVDTGPDAGLTPAMAACTAAVALVFPLLRASNGMLRGLHHTLLGQVSETVVKPGAQLAILILLAALGSSAVDLTAALASLAFATVLATAVALALRRRLRPPELQRAPMRQEDRQRWLRSLLPVSLTGGLLLLSQQLDVIMLGLLASDAQTGVYKVAAQASLIVPIVLQAATPVFAPHTAGLHARMDHARLQRQIGRATGLIFLISLLPTALFVAFGAHILAGVFGPAYATGHLPFAILCLAQLGNVACGFTGLLLEMTGRERDATAGVAGGVLTNLVLNLVLIPPYGMAGAAVATAVGLLVWNMLLVVSIRRRLNINATAFNPTIWRDIFRAPAKP